MGRIAGVSVLLALSLLLGGIVTASAQTLSDADAVDQLASACRGDLAKYCSKVELGNGQLEPASMRTRTWSRRAVSRPASWSMPRLPGVPPRSATSADLRRRYRKIVRHIACRCASRGMPAERCADHDESGLQPGLHRYRLANGKGSAMIRHQIYAVAALILAVAATVAAADTRLNSGQIATSLAAVSNNGGLDLTAAQMRQAVLDNIRNYPGALPPRALNFPQLANLAQFTVEINFNFNSAVIRPNPTATSAPSPTHCIIRFSSVTAFWSSATPTGRRPYV